MQIILLRKVEKLGQMGDIVNVKPGYARNYLIPQGHADRATKEKVAEFANVKKQLEADNLKHKSEAEKVAIELNGLMVKFISSAGESGNLYGSIRPRDIAVSVTESGFSVTKSQILIDETIKMIGIHTLKVQLHPEVSVEILVNVARSDEEAKLQEKEFTSEKEA